MESTHSENGTPAVIGLCPNSPAAPNNNPNAKNGNRESRNSLTPSSNRPMPSKAKAPDMMKLFCVFWAASSLMTFETDEYPSVVYSGPSVTAAT